MIQHLFQQDISAIIFEFLELKDLLHLKLCNKPLKDLINTISPVHHFVNILQSIEKKQPIPKLVLPSNFVLRQSVAEKVCKQYTINCFLGCATTWCHVVEVMTRFLLHFHKHDFCLQVMEWFPFDEVLLFHLCTTPPFHSSSNTMKRLAIWKHLRMILSQSALSTEENRFSEVFSKIEYYTVNKNWISATGWDTLLIREGVVVHSLELYPNVQLNNSTLLDTIIESNPNLLLYLMAKKTVSFRWIVEKDEQWKRLLHQLADKKVLVMKIFLRGCGHELLRQAVSDFGLDTITDEHMVIEAVKINNTVFEHLPTHWKQNKRVILNLSLRSILKYLYQCGSQVRYCKPFLLNLARKVDASSTSSDVTKWLHSTIAYFLSQRDMNFVTRMIEIVFKSRYIPFSSLLLPTVPKSILGSLSIAWNEENWDANNSLHVQFVLQEMKQGNVTYDMLPITFKNRVDIKRVAIERNDLYCISNLVKDDPILMEAVLQDGLKSFISQCTDQELLLKFIKKKPSCYNFVSEPIKNDPEFTIKVLKQGSHIFDIPKSFHSNKNVMFEAVKLDGTDLSFASNDLKDDIEITKEAVKQNIFAANSVSQRIKNDKESMLQLLEVNGGLLDYIWTKFYVQEDNEEEMSCNISMMQQLLSIALKGNVASVRRLPETWMKYADSIMSNDILKLYSNFYELELKNSSMRLEKKIL